MENALARAGNARSGHVKLQASHRLVRRKKAFANRHPAKTSGQFTGPANQPSPADNSCSDTGADGDEHDLAAPFRGALPSFTDDLGVAVAVHQHRHIKPDARQFSQRPAFPAANLGRPNSPNRIS